MQLIKGGLKPHGRKLMACLVALIMLLSMLGAGSPGTAWANTDSGPPAESLGVNINDTGEVTTEPLAAPVLIADSTDNDVGRPVDITFNDDADWMAAISGISVEGNALNTDQWEVTAGNINIVAEAFTAASDYEIVVQANGYSDATVTQSILRAPPTLAAGSQRADNLPLVLTADTANNFVGQSVKITFADDETWHNAISGVTVDGKALTSGKYQVNPGNIIIAADVFTIVGEHTVTVHASGYDDVVVIQPMREAIVLTLNGTAVENPITYAINEQALPVTTITSGDYTATGITVENVLGLRATIGEDWDIIFRLADGTRTKSYAQAKELVVAYEQEGQNIRDEYQGTIFSLRLLGADTNWSYLQEIVVNDPAILFPPSLEPDSTNNFLGQDITLTFTENEAWRNAVTEVIVNGAVLAQNQYDKTVDGELTIDQGVFGAPIDYAITVKAHSYIVASVTQNIMKVPHSGVWDGSIDTNWYSGDGPYYLYDASDLAGLAYKVNNDGVTFAGKTIHLMNDIYLNDHASTAPDNTARPWTPIGLMGRADFFGTFEGNGHVIHNMYVCLAGQTEGGALFGFTTNATIRNLGVTGYAKSFRHAAGIVGETCGSTVVEYCFNGAYIVGDDSGRRGSGGVVGYNNGTVRYCYNVGRIAGLCRTIGGVVGGNSGLVEYCCNAADVTAGGGDNWTGAVVATNYGTMRNCYWDNSKKSNKNGGLPYNDGGTSPNSSGVATAVLKGLSSPASDLSPYFVVDSYDINGGYPIFAWQVPGTTYAITTATDLTGGTIAACKAKAAAGDIITVTATPITGYELSTVTYTPNGGSATAAIVTGNQGAFIMPAADVAVTATFVKNAHAVTFAVTPEGATVVVKNSAGDTMNAAADGSYILKNGTYAYTVRASGYATAGGSFVVAGEEQTITINLAEAGGLVSFAVTPEGAVVVVKNSAGDTMVVEPDGSYVLSEGTYNYTVSSDGYDTASGSFTVTGEAQTITVSLVETVFYNITAAAVPDRI